MRGPAREGFFRFNAFRHRHRLWCSFHRSFLDEFKRSSVVLLKESTLCLCACFRAASSGRSTMFPTQSRVIPAPSSRFAMHNRRTLQMQGSRRCGCLLAPPIVSKERVVRLSQPGPLHLAGAACDAPIASHAYLWTCDLDPRGFRDVRCPRGAYFCHGLEGKPLGRQAVGSSHHLNFPKAQLN